MKRMQTWRWILTVLLLAAGGTQVLGEGLRIQSFDGTGQLSFNRVSTATVYRVEWAPSPAGPWTNFTGAAGAALDNIAQFASGSYTCSVPMCYRVIATVTNAPHVIPAGMVAIPAGTNIGTDPDFGAYSLTVAAFCMDTKEVTKAKWDDVYTWAVSNGYSFDNAGSGKAASHPVQKVNWYDCVKWCNARSQKEGKTPCYNLTDWSCDFAANGYRLPTSAEWEYAARGGLNGTRFPWGDIIDHTWGNYYGWPASYTYDQGYGGYDTRYATGAYPYTSPAGAFAANGYGLYDMTGNVLEWCNDESGSNRDVRGGSWNLRAFAARCGFINWIPSTYAYDSNGFRTVCR